MNTSVELPSALKPKYILAAAAVMMFTLSAKADTVVTYIGQDDGSPVGGPNPSSSAAQSAFLSAAASYGAVSTLTFENVPLAGTTSPTIPTVTSGGVTIDQAGTNFGAFGLPGYTGVNDMSAAAAGINPDLAGYNTTPGGANFYGISGFSTDPADGLVTVSFDNPTNAAGSFITGLQSQFTGSFIVTLDDGTVIDTLPINVNGGAEYLGFTDTTAFSSFTILDTAGTNGADAIGIDDLSYNQGVISTSVTPEPSSLVLLGTGILGAANMARRKFRGR